MLGERAFWLENMFTDVNVQHVCLCKHSYVSLWLDENVFTLFHYAWSLLSNIAYVNYCVTVRLACWFSCSITYERSNFQCRRTNFSGE